MAARRGENEDSFDGWIVDDGLDVGGCAKGELLRVSLGALGGAARSPANLGAIGEVEKAFRMRLRRRSQTDDGQADFLHRTDASLFVGLRSPLSHVADAWASRARRHTVKTWDWLIAVSVRAPTSLRKFRK